MSLADVAEYRIPACAKVPFFFTCGHVSMEEWILQPQQQQAEWPASPWALSALKAHLLPELVSLVGSYLDLCGHCHERPAVRCVSRADLGLPACRWYEFCHEHHRVMQHQCLVHAYTHQPVCAICLAFRRACPQSEERLPRSMPHRLEPCPRCGGPYCVVQGCGRHCGWCGLSTTPSELMCWFVGKLAWAGWQRLKAMVVSRPCKRRRLIVSPASQ